MEDRGAALFYRLPGREHGDRGYKQKTKHPEKRGVNTAMRAFDGAGQKYNHTARGKADERRIAPNGETTGITGAVIDQ